MRYLTALLAACLSVTSFAFDVPCLDPLACNFMEEGECFFTDENGDPCVIEGCTIEGACNYNPEADIYDGSCEFVSCLGCTDSEACNYDETALYDDATCIYYVDCNGTCGGDWIEDACGNCSPEVQSDTIVVVFDFTGEVELFTVPPGVDEIFVQLYGAQGGTGYDSSGGYGGLGGYVSGFLQVVEGQNFIIRVGGEGGVPTGGWNGGGDGVNGSELDGTGGGGASDIRSWTGSIEDRVVVAGGGGGGLQGPGGAGGGLIGNGGSEVGNGVWATGGTQTSGGTGGIYNNGSCSSGAAYAGSGTFGIGGQGVVGCSGGSGGCGGGGGYYGGGGMQVNGAGGGSSYLAGLIDGHTESGVRYGNGEIIISWLAPEINCNPGCTYAQACNYNPESNFDDGSCDYCFCGEGTQWVDSLQACMVTEAALMQACGEGTYWDDLAQACLTIETCQEDLDGDGIVGVNDLLELLSSFGSECVIEPETTEFTCGEPVNYHGYDYATVLIGEQCWFAENLRTEHYANGDAIPANLSEGEWSSTTSGAVAVYGEDTSCTDDFSPDGNACEPDWSLNEYGRLYNWYAVDDERGLCPSGWHVPTDEEWMTLEMELGMSASDANSQGWRGTYQGTQMKTDYGWYGDGNGTNSSGFSALPGGMRNSIGYFVFAGLEGSWWCSSPSGSNAWFRRLGVGSGNVYRGGGDFSIPGFSIRCLKDSE